MDLIRRRLLLGLGALPWSLAAGALPPWTARQAAAWERVLAVARGQQIFFNAWGGDEAINRYVAWASGELAGRFRVRLRHVRVTDISEAVSRLLAERTAGRQQGGSIDLLWINGENFASLRKADLLWGPWTGAIPHAGLIDETDNPTTVVDMTLPTDGYELAWGTARFTLLHDSRTVPVPPRDPAALLDFVRTSPGRFTYPQPPNFLGTSFLKQVLLLLVPATAPFLQPVEANAATEALTAPLWAWLDAAHPQLWRRGRLFPASGPALRRLLGDGEVDFAMAFNPAEAERAIARGELPASIRTTSFSGGALTNSHYLAIPYNSSAREGALVAANFLISPEAQARKANPAVWGDPTVLALSRLKPAQAALFPAGAALPFDGPVLPEPHPDWIGVLERAWARRYQGG